MISKEGYKTTQTGPFPLLKHFKSNKRKKCVCWKRVYFSFEKKMGPIENETKRNYEGWKNG